MVRLELLCDVNEDVVGGKVWNAEVRSSSKQKQN